MGRFRPFLLFLAIGGFVLTGAATALAEGPPVSNQTTHFVDATQTFPTDICTGDPAVTTVTFNGVRHRTLFADGTVHFAQVIKGTFVLNRLDTSAPVDATGSFIDRREANGFFAVGTEEAFGQAEGTRVLSGEGINTADGSTFRFHNSEHLVTDDFGDLKAGFEKAFCE